MKKITIIGGGASGTLLTVNLLKHAGGQPLEINFVEKKSRRGKGVAFGTTFETHLLNVPAGRMGGFRDDVGHFYEWLTANGHKYDPHDFVPRLLFGDYLKDLLGMAAANPAEGIVLKLIDDEAVDVTNTGSTSVVSLQNGGQIVSDIVVLAFGNFAPPHPNVPDLAFAAHERYFQNPWEGRLYDSLAPDDSIFIIGTGLSMVDVAMHLKKNGHRGKISAISTRGMLPTIHELGHTYPAFNEEVIGSVRITDLLKTVRRHVKKAHAEGSNWRAVIDALRPVTQQIWLDLPLAEKRYFMQHLSRYWNVARHRMPPEAAEVIAAMRTSGDLDILKGRLRDISVGDGRFAVRFAEMGVERLVTADVLVNCIGSESNFAKVDSDLIRNLIAGGLVRVDDLSLGLDARPDGAVIGSDGDISPRLFTLGTALKGILWESTAIPEIRVQARDLALKLSAI